MGLLSIAIVGSGLVAGADLAIKALESAEKLLFDGAGKAVLEDVQARLRAWTGTVPRNHDLERALRLAELTTSLVLLGAYRQEAEDAALDHRSARVPPFIDAATKALHGTLGANADLKLRANEALSAELETDLDRILASRAPETLRAVLRTAELQVWNDLVAGAAARGQSEAPADFRAQFFGETPDHPGWAIVFQAFVREALKKTPVPRRLS